MGKGGVRIGAGGKPQPKRLMDDAPVSVVSMPRDLSEAERVVWKRLAPAARRMRTLTAETSEGFRLLVSTVVMRDEARRRLDADGLTVTDARGDVKVHPVAVHARQLTARAEALLGRFLLAAQGKRALRPVSSQKTPATRLQFVSPTTGDDEPRGLRLLRRSRSCLTRPIGTTSKPRCPGWRTAW